MRAATQPCRCLWRGFLQITSTLPWRRTILHFSHIGLTDGLTFMIPFGWIRWVGSGRRYGCRYHPWITHKEPGSDGPSAIHNISKSAVRSVVAVPRGQDARPVGRYRDGELEVRSE
jgi:hypothetical protein